MAAIGEPVPERAGPLDYDEAEWRFEVRQASYAGRGAREAATDHAHCERCFRHAHLRFAPRSYAVIHKVYGGNEAQLSFAWHRSRDHSHPAHDKQGIKSGSAAFVEGLTRLCPKFATQCSRRFAGARRVRPPFRLAGRRTAGGLARRR
jgi:hypothetical protein